MSVSGELQNGTVIGGYRVDELISRGGMGVVYRVTNLALDRIYALKVLIPELAEDIQFRQRFKREMRIAASLDHPNIVGIHHADEADGLLYFVMDYVMGTDLRQILLSSGAINPERAIALLEQLAGALDAAHSRGLVHRDVKPANTLITVKEGEERAYLTDFGLAKKSEAASALTAKGVVVGTVDYMAPEQITGAHVDARTDIYALGSVFYQMLTGKVPYERVNSLAVLFAHVHEPPPPLDGAITDLYPNFASVIDKAMAKDPDDRYLSAGDFARDAAAVLEGMRYAGPAKSVATGEATVIVSGADAGAGDVWTPDVGAGHLSGADGPEIPARAAPESEFVQPAASAPPDVGQPAAPAQPTASPTPDTGNREPKSELIVPKGMQPAAGEPTVAPGSGSREPPPSPPSSPARRAPATSGDRGQPPGTRPERSRYRLPGLIGLLGISAAVAAVIALSGGSSAPAGKPFRAGADPVPTNRVTGSGSATVQLHGQQVTVTVDTNGLLNGSPHATHIHAGGRGVCPPAGAAHLHNGHQSISTTDGIKWYGPPQVALTSTGDISPKSIVDFARYPAVGAIRYRRTFTIPQGVADAIAAGNAVIVVHGIDYNGNGIYDNVLDRSELNKGLPGEATAPALCGPLVGSQTAASERAGDKTYASVLRPYGSTSAADGFSLLCHTLAADLSPAAGPKASPRSPT